MAVERNAEHTTAAHSDDAQRSGDDAHQTGSGRGWHGDPEGHAAAGRKGGQKVARNKEHMASIGRKGGEAGSRDRQHMAEIGRKGGQAVLVGDGEQRATDHATPASASCRPPEASQAPGCSPGVSTAESGIGDGDAGRAPGMTGSPST